VIATPNGQRSDGRTPEIETLTIAVVGEPTASKGNLIRALIGPERASIDRLPGSQAIRRYRIQLHDPLARLVLLEVDSPREMYAPHIQAVDATCDVILLVVDAPTIELSRFELPDSLQELPGIPVIVVLTSCDQLMDRSHQELSDVQVDDEIRQFTEGIRDEIGNGMCVIPVWNGIAPGAVDGIRQWLVPAVTNVLSRKQAKIFLHAIAQPGKHAETEPSAVVHCGQQTRVGV
jgi:hypothetical protein